MQRFWLESSSPFIVFANPYYPDKDKLYAWACHLAYGQFHVDELKSGRALEYLENLSA